MGLSRSTRDKWDNNWTPCVLLKYVYWWKEQGKVYFNQQNTQDLINRSREALQGFKNRAHTYTAVSGRRSETQLGDAARRRTAAN